MMQGTNDDTFLMLRETKEVKIGWNLKKKWNQSAVMKPYVTSWGGGRRV